MSDIFRYTILITTLTVSISTNNEIKGFQNDLSSYMWEKQPSKYALVIGNSDYEKQVVIGSASSDADSMAVRFKQMEFDSIIVRKNVRTLREFDELLGDFNKIIHEGDIVFFYFSGHGFSFRGTNYVTPTAMSSSIETKTQIYEEALPIDSVSDLLSKHSPGFLALFIDACRSTINVSFEKGLWESDSTITKGYANNRSSMWPVINNRFVGFSAETGSDSYGYTNSKKLSPYTYSLNNYIDTIGIQFFKMYREVITDVVINTERTQFPGILSWSMTNPILRPTEQQLIDEKEIWESVLNTGLYKEVEKYLLKNSISRYADAARHWLVDNKENKIASKYTFVSPYAVDKAWELMSNDPEQDINIIRSVGTVAYARTYTYASTDWTSESLLFSGEKTEDFSERMVMENTVKNIESYGQVIATTNLRAYESPTVSSYVYNGVESGSILNIKDIFIDENDETWALAQIGNNDLERYFKVELDADVAPLNLGSAIKEVYAEPREGTYLDLVNKTQITEAINELAEQGFEITWVSLSTNTAADIFETGNREARLLNAIYIIEKEGIDHRRITSVVSNDININDDRIRIRFFGYQR